MKPRAPSPVKMQLYLTGELLRINGDTDIQIPATRLGGRDGPCSQEAQGHLSLDLGGREMQEGAQNNRFKTDEEGDREKARSVCSRHVPCNYRETDSHLRRAIPGNGKTCSFPQQTVPNSPLIAGRENTRMVG